jgi:predicted small metal-binding protein
MAKYYIDCREVGYLDCDFSTEGDTIEQVVERCAEHGRRYHNLRGFGAELFARMRPHIRRLEAGSAALRDAE